jgi:uncharacterized metal-binding protein YceD (DUF177 family)
VTLDPVPGAVSETFSLVYGPPAIEAEGVGGIDDDAAYEPLYGETIDVGEAVAQEFSLALPPFPRSPDLQVEAEPGAEPDAAAAPGPFAGLSRLVGRDGGET